MVLKNFGKHCLFRKQANHLLIELDVGEYRVHPPCLGEHGPEGQREACHQKPRPGCADVWEGLLAGQSGVQTQEDDATVRQHAANDY